MSNIVFVNILRFLALYFLQVLILRPASIGWEGFFYVNVHIYPLFILLLPLRMSKPVIMILAFIMGLLIDMFYDSPGIHASALLFMAYARSYVLSYVEPREGYNVNYSPTKKRFGLNWFFQYASILIALQLFFYHSVEGFTFVYIIDILLKTFYSYLLTIIVIMMVMFLFNTTD